LNPAADLIDRVAASPAIAARLRQAPPVVFDHVAESAQPFLAALIARKRKKRFWIVCENVRAQEHFHTELLNWLPDALFFPAVETAAVKGALVDPEVSAERLEVLQRLLGDGREAVVVSAGSLEDDVPAPKALQRTTLALSKGARLDREALLERLAAGGYERVEQISSRGQYAVRGGILDVFSWQHTLPVRIELFDDIIESLRQFDLDAQTSVQPLETCRLLLGGAKEQTCLLREYVGSGLLIDVTAEPLGAAIRLQEGSGEAEETYAGAFHDHGLGEFDAGDLVIAESKRETLFRQLREWRREKWRVFIFCNNEGEAERLRDLLPEEERDGVGYPIGTVARGFTFPEGRVAVLSDAELFGRYRNTRARRRLLRRAREHAQIDFTELNEGDFVVHLEHGVARYAGLRSFTAAGGKPEEVLELEFAEEAKLYVPLEQAYLVSRYVGVGKKTPLLNSLGDGKWAKARKSAEHAIHDYAAKLLSVHAERETRKGYAFAPDGRWQNEFESSFLYDETPDQLTAIAAAKGDMESERPMDRLICGDVGFGKTEVAIRAAFKAVMSGKQVALLAPTTVLAQQHWQTFRERMSDYPVVVESLSRFRSAAEQRAVVEGLRSGAVDIVVGTHRLVSKDVRFKDLGLVVIDEEQRFGVLHKEKFKALFALVDMLTLSATPIPRTLYLSLMGAKDMSVLETAPPNRIPIETVICGYDERIIRDAIRREIERQGQVYFLHNRVRSIERVRTRILELCPKARVEIGHGQMDEDELEGVMRRFVAGETDVLVSTTIIESGLDIPNANTIIIDRADRFGLADLYQLRGRVGRAEHKAYAYLLLPPDLMQAGAARKRINAIKQYSSLGAGFKIAMRDLEIRGAGNILGTAQSGHIFTIGFDLYCQLLKQAIARIKGEKVRPRLETALRLDFVSTNEAEAGADKAPAFLPASYITQARTRIQAYRKLAEVASPEELEQLSRAWRDRFGPPPEPVENLLLMAGIKLAAAQRKITALETREKKVIMTRGGDMILLGGKFPRLTSGLPKLELRELSALIKTF